MKSTAPTTLDELMSRLPDYYTPADRESIQRAYRVAEKAHSGQKRASGEPYINHLLAVAAILAEYSMPADVVTAGLLHDTIEDTSLKAEDLRLDFSDEIVNLVQGVTKGPTAKGMKTKPCANANANFPSRLCGRRFWPWIVMSGWSSSSWPTGYTTCAP